MANLLALPWALKFLWSPAVDRVPGARARMILPLNVMAIAFLVALSFVSPGSIVPLVVTVLLCNLVAATQDIATDGYAVEVLRDDERGLGNGVQVGGYRLGMIVGGGAIVAVFDRIGWQASFLIAAGCVALATIPAAFAPAAPRSPPETSPSLRDAMLHRWFGEDGAQRWFWLLVLYKFGDAFGTSMVRPYFVDRGLLMEQIGVMLGMAGSLAGMTGAAIGGACADRFGRRACLLVFGSLQVATMSLYALTTALPNEWFWAAVVAEHLCSGMATATLFAAMMDAARKTHAGVDYTVQASVQVGAAGIAAAISGWSAAQLGYGGHFGLSVLLCALPVWLVWMWPKDAPTRFSLR
jgi:MFS family permease